MEFGDWINVIGLLLGFPIAWLIYKFRGTDKKIDDMKDDAGARNTQLAVIESRIETHEKHVDGKFHEITASHEAELTQFRDEVKGIKSELRLLRKDFSDGFDRVSNRIIDLITADAKK